MLNKSSITIERIIPLLTRPARNSTTPVIANKADITAAPMAMAFVVGIEVIDKKNRVETPRYVAPSLRETI